MEDNNKDVKRPAKFYIWCIIWGIFVLLLFGVASTRVNLSKIQYRDEGMFAVETLYSDGEITGVGESHVFANGRRRRRQHNVSFYINEIQDYSGTRVPEEELENYSVGDKVVIMREVYYLKPGFRMFYQDSIFEVKEG